MNRNWNKTTKVAFLSEVQNLFAWTFFASCVMMASLFSMLSKCVSSWQEGVSLWLMICHHDTQNMYSHSWHLHPLTLTGTNLKLMLQMLKHIYQWMAAMIRFLISNLYNFRGWGWNIPLTHHNGWWNLDSSLHTTNKMAKHCVEVEWWIYTQKIQIAFCW